MSVFLSIIVPLYNVENYLEKSIGSLLSQNGLNTEILLINDGSTDNSMEVIQRLSSKDKRIRVFEQDHLGQGAARNLGLKKANGEYIAFLDADDYLSSDFLTKISYLKNSEKRPDIAIFNYVNVDSNTGKKINEVIFDPKKQNYSDILCNKLYLKSFLINNHLNFPENIKFEDSPFTHTSYVLSKSKLYLPFIGYYYRRNRQGSTTTSIDKKKIDMYILGLLSFKQYIIDHQCFMNKKQQITLFQKLGKGVVYKLSSALNILSFSNHRIKKFKSILNFPEIAHSMKSNPSDSIIWYLSIISINLHNKLFFKLVNDRAGNL